MSRLSVRMGRYPHTDALFAAPPEDVELEVATPGLTARQMVRELAFDACELPLVNYFSAREHGVPITALPVFLTRRFVHATLVCNRRTGVAQPKDLEGKRVGIGYYGNTDTTWAQGMLERQFGVDCERITFVASQEEQIAGAGVPPNVQRIGSTAQTSSTDALPAPRLGEMLAAGDLAAVVYGVPPKDFPNPEVQPLFGDLDRVEREWWDATGLFPILHTFVVHNDVLHRAGELYAALCAAKRASPPTPPDRAFLPDDAMPYGLNANRTNLTILAQIAHARHILASVPVVDDLFVHFEDESNTR